MGLIAFKILGGRFWAISPSSYTNLGSFARVQFSLPATQNYGTAKERALIGQFGRRFGCHTCGSRKMFSRLSGVKFHADHMPPKAVTKQMNNRWYRKALGLTVQQRFYPQCTPCSNTQGGLLSQATKLQISHMTNKSRRLIPLGTGTPNLAGAGGGRVAHFHGLRPRLNHLAGGTIAAITVYDCEEEEVLDGNRRRFSQIQEMLQWYIVGAWYMIEEFRS